jgi:hypothetical protein
MQAAQYFVISTSYEASHCFLWFHLYKIQIFPSDCLWSSNQGFWLQIQTPRFDSWRYHIFWEVVSLELGPLSLVSTTEELFGRKSSGSDHENQDYGHRDSPHWPRDILYPQKLLLTSPTSGGCSVSIVRSRTKVTKLLLSLQPVLTHLNPHFPSGWETKFHSYKYDRGSYHLEWMYKHLPVSTDRNKYKNTFRIACLVGLLHFNPSPHKMK